MRFILLFSQEHLDFRLAEIRGICSALNLKFEVNQLNTEEHIFVVTSDEENVRLLLSRSMLLKSAYQYLFEGNSLCDLKNQLSSKPELIKPFDKVEESFAVKTRPVGKKKGVDCLSISKDICEYVPLDIAPVNLQNPTNTFTALLEFENEKCSEPKRIFFCRQIGDGQGYLKTKYNLKDRCYIGNTTMDPELSFIQANISAVKSGSLVLDPFVGTGGLIIAAAEFGGNVIGSELNYQVVKGIGKSSRQGQKHLTDKENIVANFTYYKTQEQLLGIIIADASQHGLWRTSPIFECIVSDPPYGVREKGRKVGKKERKEHWTIPGNTHHEEHYPEKQRYSIEDTFLDLCNLAAKILTIGGRVSFWFPVILEKYSTDCLPSHPALLLIENCEQQLTKKTSRRLLTYEKLREPNKEDTSMAIQNLYEDGTFRDALFGKQS